MKFKRMIFNDVKKHFVPGKVAVLYGSRRTGKTTLAGNVVSKDNTTEISGDLLLQNRWITSQNLDIYKQYLAEKETLYIDEAQKIPQIGLVLKIIVDNFRNLKVIATGSSSFEITNQIGEPLVGRKWQWVLYPISVEEMLLSGFSQGEVNDKLNSILIYGMYPEVLNTNQITDKERLLYELVESQLYRDILQYKDIRNSTKLLDLLKLLSWQIGKEVSLHELGKSLGLSSNTVFNYLDLLEKVFLIKKVRGYSTNNKRKEISKKCRYYFLDNGVRNCVIDNFAQLNNRSSEDIGMLWENFIYCERLKMRSYSLNNAKEFFWRTEQKAEVDLVEEYNQNLHGFKIKWDKIAKPPLAWAKSYPNAKFTSINKSNYFDFITSSHGDQ